MKTAKEIELGMNGFYGTEVYHQWSFLFKNMYLTDGAQYIAVECGAFWLMDAIASHLPAYRESGFACVTLKVEEGLGELVITDGNEKVLATQAIGYTDFPLRFIKFYVEQGADEDGNVNWVILLPGEH